MTIRSLKAPFIDWTIFGLDDGHGRLACSSIASINSSSVMFASADCSLTLMFCVSAEQAAAQLRQLDLDDKNYGRPTQATGGAPQKGTSNYPLRLRDGAGVFTECAMCNCPRAGPSASV